MFIERIANKDYSSVGAASATRRCRSYGASELLSEISINITLLWSGRSCVDTSAAEVARLRHCYFRPLARKAAAQVRPSATLRQPITPHRRMPAFQ